jgi:uncharacterized protein
MYVGRVRRFATRWWLTTGPAFVLITAITTAAVTVKQQLVNATDSEFRQLQDRARHGDAGAEAAMGVAYEEGIHVAKDMKQAVEWYRRAAEQGNAEVQHHLAALYEAGHNFTDAALWYRKAAEQGNAPAQCNLGTLYHDGRGVERDLAEAAKWFEVGARQGDAQAESNIGYMYNYGEGVRQDYGEAVKWYRLAAEQGFAIAQKNLGTMYALGQGVEQDEHEALRWFASAADHGLAMAWVNAALLYMQGSQINRDYERAGMLLNKAIAAGVVDAKPLLQNLAAMQREATESQTADAAKPKGR